MEASEFVEDFGQKVDLTQRIREVLLNYPEGTTILKELVQNADDAGATKVCFCVDRRQHGVESLMSRALAEWQGPALLAYNNAQFTEEDFQSISRIGDSRKQEHAWKTGRFGIGFNSVYHLSDLPSFVSGKYVVLFDPHCKYLPSISSTNPGKRIDFVSSSAFEHYRDQFAPYCAFGCDMEHSYPGTLFRFPLRSAEQAAVSRLSRQGYTSDDMFHLLQDLYAEAVQILLFLKNVEVIEIYEWTSGASCPSQLYSCFVQLPTSALRLHRQMFVRQSRQVHSGVETREQADVFRLDLISRSHQGADSGEGKISSFFIAQVMGSSSSRIGVLARIGFKSYGLRLLPWASVAANISSLPGNENEQEGRAFCFLPLPLKTGMSIHVNGYFELSANRRDIWYGSDMDRLGKFRSDWNGCILEDVAASCLLHLLSEARKLGSGPTYHSMWPVGSFREPWDKMVKHFYKNVKGAPLLYSPVGKGRWLTLVEAVFHDEEYDKSDVLASALIAEGLPLVRLPTSLRGALFRHCEKDLNVVTPYVVRRQIQKDHKPAERAHVFTLLDYCLSDLVDEEAAEQLMGLWLVPLQNQMVGRFGLAHGGSSYYLCNSQERRLLESIPSKLIDQDLPDLLLERLSKIALSGQSNISCIDDKSLGELLQHLLPPEWKNCEEVIWKPGIKAHPSKEWLSFFWEYLCDQQRNLSKLQEWPILPTNLGTLRRLKRNAGILLGGKIRDTMETVLTKGGCAFLDRDIIIQHPHLSRYAFDPTAAEVLDGLAYSVSCDYSLLAQRFASLSGPEKKELRSFLYNVVWINKTEMNEFRLKTLKSLPIFEAYNDSGDGLTFIAVEGFKKFLAPKGVDNRLLGIEFLHSSNARETEILSQLLGVVPLKKAEFFKWRVINRITEIPAETRDPIMLQILRDLSELSYEDRSLVGILKSLKFVPTGAGKVEAPDTLYDPESLELLNLLNEPEFFPAAPYATSEVLQALRNLGLKTTVTPDTVLASARTVESLLARDPVKAVERGRVLLSYLDANSGKWLPSMQEAGIGWILSKASSLLQGERDAYLTKFWNDISNICWCPVLTEPPHPQMPWPSISQPLAPPRLVRLASDMWLVSATMRILDGTCQSPGLSQCLGWSSRLGCNILAAQLLELGRNDNHQLGKVLATTIPRVYSLLSDMLGTDEMEIVKVILEDRPWVWVGSGFTTSRKVVFDGPSHLSPYLYIVPADLAAFKELFMELGVRESLEPLDYSKILSVIAAEKPGNTLDSWQLRAVVWIVQYLADMNFGDQGIELFVPDYDGILRSSSELVYNDAPWLLASKDGHTGSSNISEKKKFVHAKISNDVAEKVGISSVRKYLLAESADFMDLGIQAGMEAFGQSESLTNRLKQIVEMYADGPGILFELLQNADDAGASEACFLLDKTSYGTDSVLCRQMADWQGPALYCYNNSVFKPEDLRAISRIGQNSKLEKPSAIGRFGLGFNSVYHFTDVPGFVSGANIVMLDPHAANLPGITPAQPGLKISFVGKSLLKQFPDQFQPFLLFGCDLQRPFEGTLFRFPLRTTTTAARSEIKQDACSPEDVVTLFTALKKSAGEVMLFLRNVRTIKVYLRESGLQEVFKVEKENVSYQESLLYEFVRGTGEQRNDREEFVKRLERTTDKRLPWSCGKIKLVLTSEDHTSCSSWLISSALGGGKAKEFAVASSNRSRGFVPWAGVAAKLPEDGNAQLTGTDSSGGLQVEDSPSLLEGRAFCFLPLPVEPGIPVHVNGYFELSANRRDVWYGGDMVGGGRLRSEWNGCLLEDAGAPAYARLLHQAAQELGPSSSFYSLWPKEHAAEPWKLLVQQIYKVIVDLELPVLYTATRRGKWISARQAVFPDFSFSEMEELGNALVDIGLPLVRVTKIVVEKFRQFCPTLRYLTPQLLRRLLLASRRTFGGHIAALALKYAMADVETPEDEVKLYGLSLIPLANGSFGTFNSRAAGGKIILVDENERKLLIPALAHLLVAPELGDDVMLKLKQVAENGVSNVFLITCQLLQELLGMVLPLDWAGKDAVLWMPGVQGHPTIDWMELLWRFLDRHCDDLSAFASWPLLPTSDGRLLRLVKCGPVLLNDGWSENMASLLQKCGCFLLRSDMPVKHPLLRDYVQDASGRGILLAMFSAAGGNLKMLPTLLRNCSGLEIRELRQFMFQSKWFASSQIGAVEMEILKMLRLFENDDNLFCIAESKQLIAPDDIDQQLLADMFIRAEPGKGEQILRTCLGLRKLSKEEYFREHFVESFSLIPLGRRMDVFQKVVKDLRQYMEFSSASMTALSQLPFVPTDSGAVEPPKRLYDPRVSELQTLLNKQAFFPSDDFQKNAILDILVLLGLRGSLGREGLLDCARSVAMLSNTDDSEASARGKALLTHLDSLLAREGSLDSPPEDQELWVELSSISWCPVRVTSPNPFLPWLSGQLTSVASPKVVRPASDIWLVSSSMRILDGDCGSTLQAKLGWKQAPNSGVLANQLIELCSCYRQLQKSEKGLDDITNIISKEVKTIYTIFRGLLETEGLMVVQSMLEGHAWLWIGEGFVMAREAAFDAPGHFHPYLHVVPMELLEFKELFASLGVRETFGAADYVNVLQRVAADLKGDALNSEQLTFVLRSLEALGETFQVDYDAAFGEILMPDAASYLVPAKELIYNDAPWLAESFQGVGKILRLVHPDVDTNLARQLGARSLRYLSVVDQEMTSSLPCMGMEKISDMLSKFGNQDFLFFDLIEVADCCQARKVHFVYDSQEHPKQSLLQPNLGDFQGPALIVVFEGVDLSTDEICGLHTSPPVRFHGQACRYGSGLLAAYHVTNLLLVISSGSLYLYDPSGQVIVPALADGSKDPTGNPIGKAFSLQGTGLPEKFSDQFRPFNVNHEMSWRTPGRTILRLPLRSGIDKSAVVNLFNNFKQHAANSLLFLKSVEAVTLSDWTNPECFREVFSVSLGSAFSALRHPFQEKKWRKFQLSNFFGSSNAATKTHTIDVFLKEESTTTMTKWLVVQSLASGQTRDMALDRRYLHYQLTPVAGVAACISLDGGVTDSCHGSFLSPLPVPLKFKMPVTIFGNFLLFLDGERHFFNEALGDYPVKAGMLGSHTGPSLTDEVIRATWNRHLLSCVCDSYIELLQELQHLLIGRISARDSIDGQPGRNSYSLWPRSSILESSASDAQCLVKWLVRPMYARLVDMPVWQLHAGNMVKFSEGVFVAPSDQGIAPQASVSDFFKAHYRVFSVPWELGKEAEETGAAMKELTPKALRSLMKVPSVAAAVQSVVTQVDLLEYCCADALPKNPNLGGTSDDINKAVLAELKGVTCPTANEFMVKLGTLEVWIANKEQQKLLPSLGKRFVHPSCLERPLLAALFNNRTFQLQMNLKPFSPRMIAANIWTVLPRNWADAGPWVEWEQEPSAEWIRNLWRNLNAAVNEELSLFVSWPLIPATIGSSRILVHVGQRQLVFVPPLSDNSPREDDLCGACTKAFSEIDDVYPWLVQVLGKLGIPVYNRDFLDCDAVKCCISQQEKSLVQTIVAKLVALEDAGCLQPSRAFLTTEECAQLFTLLATLTMDDNSWLTPQALSVLRALPIFKTNRNNYVELDQSLHYTVSPGAFMQPDDEQCLPPANVAILYELLGIPQLANSGILTRYALPNFSHISSSEQEKVLGHIYHNWDVLRQEATVVNALKETKFVRCASASSTNLFSPQELLDPESIILKQIFDGDGWSFPGGQFATSRWIQILRSAGLRSLKDPSLILECAKKIEELARQDLSSHDLPLLKYGSTTSSQNISEAVWSMASGLVEEILNNLSAVYSSSFCDTLSKISFIPAEKGLPTSIGGTPSRVLASYNEAVLLKDWPLAWTCSPLLTRPTVVPPEFSWGAFHLRSPPLISVVIKHLRVVGHNGGEDVLARWPNIRGSRSVEEVFGDLLQYLSNVWDGLSGADKKELSLHAFIPAANGTRLVTASSLYTRLGMDLAPFVFEVPRAYLSYVGILSDLGMKYEPTVPTMKSLLLELQQTCGYQHLNPNELQAVLSILQFICDNAKDVSNEDFAVDVVVPEENGRLVHATSCAYVDAAGVRLVDKIDASKIRFVHPRLSEGLCTLLCVKKLSATIVEEIDERKPLDFVDTLGQFNISSVRHLLGSDAFEESVWAILQGGFKEMVNTELNKEQVVDSLLFGAQNLRFVKRLCTRYFLLPGRTDITREKNSEQQAFYFVNRSANIVLAAEPPEFVTITDLLAVLVSRILDCPVCLPIGPLFNVPINKYGNLQHVVKFIDSGGRVNQQGAETQAMLGALVLPVDAKALQFCPLRPFYAGEIVGWHHNRQQSHETYYGRVVEDIRAPAGHPIYQIRVETSPGKVQLLSSSNVLSFKSTGSLTLGEQKKNLSQAFLESNSVASTSSTVALDSQTEAPDEPRVLDPQAVTDILKSLGLPLSLERQSLLEHTLSLQEQLTSANALLLTEQERADASVRETEAVKSSWTCKVCLSLEVDSMLAPCGHVMCHLCSSAMSRCPFCRKFVTSAHAMYRP